MAQGVVILLIGVVALLVKSFVKIREYERGVVFRLGRLAPVRAPGLRLIIPLVDELMRVSMRTITMDVPPQDVITRDNISVKVNAVLYFRVVDPIAAITQVEDYLYATGQFAQTTIRSVCGEVELDDLLSQREEINLRIQTIVDKQTDPWGIKVNAVELKHIDLPQEMQRAMAKQAEAERERRARIIKAEGEYQSAQKLTDAADIMSTNPQTLQLRYLDTLRDISVEHNSTILFPIPLELFEVFKKISDK
jgi:regulator of protease activity HflC (stomatin/prohibitin superfamily)